jgi:hypothetical protein
MVGRTEPKLLLSVKQCNNINLLRALKTSKRSTYSVFVHFIIDKIIIIISANIRYLEKMKKYPDLGPKFKPLVIKSTGGYHAYSMDNLKIMAGHIASRTNKPTSFALSNLLRTCSFALQRHQGTMLVRRCLGLA